LCRIHSNWKLCSLLSGRGLGHVAPWLGLFLSHSYLAHVYQHLQSGRRELQHLDGISFVKNSSIFADKNKFREISGQLQQTLQRDIVQQ